MEEFVINEYLVIKLEEDSVNIYVNNEMFRQCKYLLLVNPLEEENHEEINSIDEAKDLLNTKLEKDVHPEDLGITKKEEFWAHCSNIQAWVENDYDTRLIHSNLAFPLLRKLQELGDSKAIRTFKDEIAKRFSSGHLSTVIYLIENDYLEHLNDEELAVLGDDPDSPAIKTLLEVLKSDNEDFRGSARHFFEKLKKNGVKYLAAHFSEYAPKFRIFELKYLFEFLYLHSKTEFFEEFINKETPLLFEILKRKVVAILNRVIIEDYAIRYLFEIAYYIYKHAKIIESRYIERDLFLSTLKNYYDNQNCDVELEFVIEGWIVEYRIRPKEALYYFDMTREFYTDHPYFRTLNELRRVFFPDELVIVNKIQQLNSSDNPYRLVVGVLATQSQQDRYNKEPLKEMLDDFKELEKIAKQLKKLLESNVQFDYKKYVLYEVIKRIYLVMGDFEVRTIDYELFRSKLKEHYDRQNCLVEFEIENGLDISVFKVKPLGKNYYYNKMYDDNESEKKVLQELKDILFPEETQMELAGIEQWYRKDGPYRLIMEKKT